MCKTCMIVGNDYSTELTTELALRLQNAVEKAVKHYGVTVFYFGNNADELKDIKSSNDINETVAREVAQLKVFNSNLKSYMILARENDVCKFRELFDRVFCGKDSTGNCFKETFYSRDQYLAAQTDIIFWYSDKKNINRITLMHEAQKLKKKIIYI